MYAVTGATGQLGRLVVDALLASVPPGEVVATARDTGKAADLAVKGVAVRVADYDKPETLGPALEGVDKLLLISGTDFGARVAQHQAVIGAAKAAGVKLIAYTSVLHADDCEIGVAPTHRQTEADLKSSGVPWAMLRNGWYLENYARNFPTALEIGVIAGAAGEGKICAATRQDYAEAAAAVLTAADDQGGRVYELAGDEPFTMSDLAAELARQSGKDIVYRDMPEADFAGVLKGAGMPEPLAAMLAAADTAIAKGALYDDSHQLSALIGRPTTPLATMIADVLKQ
jgi:NAD(P)H dehydrogenase (quinone)